MFLILITVVIFSEPIILCAEAVAEGVFIREGSPPYERNYTRMKTGGLSFVYFATSLRLHDHINLGVECGRIEKLDMLCGFAYVAYLDSNPVTQATDFANGDGKWPGPSDTIRLPGALQLTDFSQCQTKTFADVVLWIQKFLETYTKIVGRKAVVHTSLGWWEQCTDDSRKFGNYPLSTPNDSTTFQPYGNWSKATFFLHRVYVPLPLVGYNEHRISYLGGDVDALKKFAKST